MKGASLLAGVVFALAGPGPSTAAEAPHPNGDFCVQCLRVRVGPPEVVRGPLADELDAPFSALKLPDGSFRGFSANATSYAIEGGSVQDMGGQRAAVLQPGAPGSDSECGRWLTSIARFGDKLLGLVHQERACDYAQGQTEKSMAIATSADDGLNWTDLGTIISRGGAPETAGITGEGDCTMVNGADDYFYAYCLRNSDGQTIVARASAQNLTDWRKYHDGNWNEPGLGGEATAIGFVGPGAGFLKGLGWLATVTTDPWFGGVRLSLAKDKVSFVDLDEPLVTIDGSDWQRPAATDLIAYPSIINPDTGSNSVDLRFLLSYVYVPRGKGFDSRYLVEQEVSLSVGSRPLAVQAGLALTRWSDPTRHSYVTSTGPLTGDRLAYRRDAIVAYVLTRAPEGIASVKLVECSSNRPGSPDQLLAEDGSCGAEGYTSERTSGWLFVTEQPGTVPVYLCSDVAAQTHFAASTLDCEGLGLNEALLGYGLAA